MVVKLRKSGNSYSLTVPSPYIQLLGIKGDNTYNNVSEARLSFWEDTAIPLAKMIMSSLADWLSGFDGRKAGKADGERPIHLYWRC